MCENVKMTFSYTLEREDMRSLEIKNIDIPDSSKQALLISCHKFNASSRCHEITTKGTYHRMTPAQVKEIIYNVYMYFKKEYMLFLNTHDGYFTKIRERVAEATGFSESYIKKFIRKVELDGINFEYGPSQKGPPNVFVNRTRSTVNKVSKRVQDEELIHDESNDEPASKITKVTCVNIELESDSDSESSDQATIAATSRGGPCPNVDFTKTIASRPLPSFVYIGPKPVQTTSEMDSPSDGSSATNQPTRAINQNSEKFKNIPNRGGYLLERKGIAMTSVSVYSSLNTNKVKKALNNDAARNPNIDTKMTENPKTMRPEPQFAELESFIVQENSENIIGE